MTSPQPAATDVRATGRPAFVTNLSDWLIEKPQHSLRDSSLWIAAAYGLGVCLMLVRLTSAYCGGKRLTSAGHPVTDPQLLMLLNQLASRLKLRVIPVVAICDRVVVPVVAGTLTPVVLLPAAMLTGLTTEQLASVMMHELAHIRRLDHVAILLQRGIEAMLFYHPLVWVLSRRIDVLREHACDDLVIDHGIDRLAYAQSLLRVAELRVSDSATRRRLTQLATDGGHPSQLRSRIARVLHDSGLAADSDPCVRISHARTTVALSFAAASVLAAGLLMAGGLRTQPEPGTIPQRDSAATDSPPSDAGSQPATDTAGSVAANDNSLIYDCDITDETTGEPIPGADVGWLVRATAWDKNSPVLFEGRFTTNQAGQYQARLPADAFEPASRTIEFFAKHPDYIPGHRVGTRLTLPDAPPPTWSDLRHLKLRRGTPVTGRIINPDGSPAADVVLSFGRDREGFGGGFPGLLVTRTDDEGRYRIAVPPSWPLRMHWHPTNAISDSRAVQRHDNADGSIAFGEQTTIRLKPGVRLRGSVVGLQGEPRGGITVQAISGTTIPVVYATTRADGSFETSPLKPGNYRISNATGYFDVYRDEMVGDIPVRPFDIASVNIPETGSIDPVVIQQSESIPLVIRSSTSRGEPAEGRQFRVGEFPNVTSRSEPLPATPGSYQVFIKHGQTKGVLSAVRHAHEANLWQLRPDGPFIPGDVVSLDRAPVPDQPLVHKTIPAAGLTVFVRNRDRQVSPDLFQVQAHYRKRTEFRDAGVLGNDPTVWEQSGGPFRVETVAPHEDVVIELRLRAPQTPDEQKWSYSQTVRLGEGEQREVVFDPEYGNSDADAAQSGVDGGPAVSTPRIVVNYDIAHSEPEARLFLQPIGGREDSIGSVTYDLLKYTPIRNGEHAELSKLDTGDYQAGRYREIEIGNAELTPGSGNFSAVSTWIMLDRQRFHLSSGQTQIVSFTRPGGRQLSGRVTGISQLRSERTYILVCSENARGSDVSGDLNTTIFDAQQCNDGEFQTEALSPGRYRLMALGYPQWTQEDLFRTGRMLPRFKGETLVTIPESRETQPIVIELHDTAASEVPATPVLPTSTPDAATNSDNNTNTESDRDEKPAPQLSISVTATDATTGAIVPRLRIVSTPYQERARSVTWQSQYLQTFDSSPARFKMERGWPQTLLRVEAPGYQPFVSPAIARGQNLTLNCQLVPDDGAEGRVLTPDGQPAANATIAVCTWTNEVTVANQSLRLGHHAEKLRPLILSGADGTFRMTHEPDEWVLVVAHPAGYAQVSADDWAESTTITLRPWGRLEGRYVVNDQPQVGQPVNVGAGFGGANVILHYGSGSVETDANGSFVVEGLPPVSLFVTPMTRDGDQSFNVLWFSGQVEISAGETTRIQLPRPGATVTGIVTFPADSKLTLQDVDLEISMQLRPPSISGFTATDDNSPSPFTAYRTFMQSAAGRTWQRSSIPVDANGKFEVAGLPESSYVLSIIARRKGADLKTAPVAAHSTRVVVPHLTVEKPIVDLDAITLRVSQNTVD